MKYDPEKHRRRSIRLKNYDYSQSGAYFVTICTKDRECLFGDISDNNLHYNDYGQIAYDFWSKILEHFSNTQLDGFIVMSNHIHGIVVIGGDGRGLACHAPTNRKFAKPISNSLSTIIGSFKSAVTKQINQIRSTPGILVWQRNYYEHIIRNEKELNKIRKYIVDNPLKWDTDENNLENLKQNGGTTYKTIDG
jgi:REP element-mobilizing transposase RayT